MRLHWFSRWLLAVGAVSSAVAQTPAQAVESGGNVSDAFWQLHGIDDYVPSRSVYLGGQNFSWCCLKAVENALAVGDNGSLIIRNNSRSRIGAASIDELLDAASQGQFPCGAKYNNDDRGAPIVESSYEFLAGLCPGWEMSSQSNVNSWLHSLSGFILPAVIFCLSVPRRRKLYIFRSFFVADLTGIKSYIPAILGAFGAGIIVAIDTIGWLATCFAFAGPMIISGLYEALLDNRILQFLTEKIHHRRLTVDMRCRCLMIILIGNLDLALHSGPQIYEYDGDADLGNAKISSADTRSADRPDHPEPSDDLRGKGPDTLLEPPKVSNSLVLNDMGQQLPNSANPRPSDPRPRSVDRDMNIASGSGQQTLRPPSTYSPRPSSGDSQVSAQSVARRPTAMLTASPWRHMEKLLYDIRLFDQGDHVSQESPRQWPKHQCGNEAHCDGDLHTEHPRPRTKEVDRRVLKTRTRLKSMLLCQYSFGSIVGAPVLFFLGGYIFAYLSSLDNLGDENIAEALAFGSWYMIIPHIAIVSGLLLAGNNPNILEGVFATERDEEPDARYFLGLRFELVYPSCYKTAWQWRRGHTKKQWIKHLVEIYGERVDVDFSGNRDADEDLQQLRAMTSLGPLDWAFIMTVTLLLIGIPFVLAFLTAYFTPQIGLACRSLTFTIYISMQVAQLMMWLWAHGGPLRETNTRRRKYHPLNFLRRDGWLHRSGFFEPNNMEWLLGKRGHRKPVWEVLHSENFWTFRTLWCGIYHFAVTLFGLGAILSSLGGTLMQIIGVYRTAMCYVNTPHWLQPPSQRPMIVLSTNSAEMIHNAVQYWEPCAISAILFMAFVSFSGWWYQRRMRDRFSQLVKELDDSAYDSPETRLSRAGQESVAGGVRAAAANRDVSQ